MSCPFAHDDGAYVLGALTPVERLAFERHLAGCEECNRSVRDIAGLPGLLGRVDASVLEEQPADDVPVPATLLPALSREARRAGRRRTAVVAGLAAAVAAVVVPVVVVQVTDQDPGRPPTSQPSEPQGRPMTALGDVPVEASVVMESVLWGTRLDLTCTYHPESVDYELPAAVDYTLFVRTRDGRAEQVGSWRSVGGKTMRLSAATASRSEQIASVEVRAPDGRVLLRLAA
jgi:hypothetical protein